MSEGNSEPLSLSERLDRREAMLTTERGLSVAKQLEGMAKVLGWILNIVAAGKPLAFDDEAKAIVEKVLGMEMRPQLPESKIVIPTPKMRM